MNFFEKYFSNILTASGNQTFFTLGESEKTYTGRTFYRIFKGGKYNYSFLFSNTVDSSFGGKSSAGYKCAPWQMHSVRYGVCRDISGYLKVSSDEMQSVTFDGNISKTVMHGEIFHSDEVMISAESGDYICVEIVFSGEEIPYLEETHIPSYIKKDVGFVFDNKQPVVSMVACDRPVNKKIAFWGDSITQGLGTGFNEFEYWCANAARLIGDGNAYWNLGIGCARASDAASGGAWFQKASKADWVSVCFGVNDILGGASAKELKANLRKIIEMLCDSGCMAGIFTIPPFDWNEEHKNVWLEVNEYIKSELTKEVQYVFDTVPVLCLNEKCSHISKYGAHPNNVGCEVLAQSYVELLSSLHVLI